MINQPFHEIATRHQADLLRKAAEDRMARRVREPRRRLGQMLITIYTSLVR